MTDEEDLTNALLDFLGEPIVNALQDCSICEVDGPENRFFSTIAQDHGVDAEELRVLLAPPEKDARHIALQLAAALLGRLRQEAT